MRVQAAYGLASLGVRARGLSPSAAAAVPVLIEALQSKNRDLRFQAMLALAFLGPVAAPAIPALSANLSDPRIGRWAAEALAGIGEQGIPALRQAANGSNREARKNAAHALGNLGLTGKTSADKLLADLKLTNSQVRQAAAQSIRSTVPNDPRVVPALIRALKDKDEFVRSSAALALGSYGPRAKSAVPALIRMLSEQESLQMAAISGLGYIGPAAQPAIPRLRALMATEPIGEAGKALARMGQPGLQALVECLKDPRTNVRSQAIWGLLDVKQGVPSALPELTEALGDADVNIRNEAAQCLGYLGPVAAPAVPKLIETLKDRDTDVRSWAANTLGLIGPKAAAAIPALRALTSDPEEGVRMEAAQGLAIIKASPSK